MAQKTWPDDFPELVGEKVMMDGSGGGGGSSMEREKNMLLYLLMLIVVGLGVVIWMLKEDLLKLTESAKTQKFENCVEQMQVLQPEVGTKYLSLECQPDGKLSVTAVYTQ